MTCFYRLRFYYRENIGEDVYLGEEWYRADSAQSAVNKLRSEYSHCVNLSVDEVWIERTLYESVIDWE